MGDTPRRGNGVLNAMVGLNVTNLSLSGTTTPTLRLGMCISAIMGSAL